MTTDELKEEVHQCYMRYYVEGFKNNDLSLIDQVVQYPIAHIHEGTVTLCDTYPIDPQRLKDELEWDHSIEWVFEVTAANERDAHATASAIRCKKDGSVIEHVHGFYAFTRTPQGWKMYAVADNSF